MYASAAVDIACDYTEGLSTDSADPAADWLPSWTRQRQEQVERDVYAGLTAHGDQQACAAARRFLTEYPAGDGLHLVDLRNKVDARNVPDYGPIGQTASGPAAA